MEMQPSVAIGLVLAMAGHAVGWPIPRGGSQAIADALASYLRSLGGDIVTGWRVESLDELPRSAATLCDVSPRMLLKLAVASCRAAIGTHWRGSATGPRPSKSIGRVRADPFARPNAVRRARCISAGHSPRLLAPSEPHGGGERCERPFVLLAQPSLIDPSRGLPARHTAWAYGACRTDRRPT